ncbi:MAG: M23 family metallopeptidase, partial [Aquificota bacterium]
YGDKVVKGQIIGKVGTTGRAFGAHLHYEVLKYGIRQNPIAYLP